MIPTIMLGIAALLFTLSIIMMQIGSLKDFGRLANIGVGLLFIINGFVCFMLIVGAIIPNTAGLTGTY